MFTQSSWKNIFSLVLFLSAMTVASAQIEFTHDKSWEEITKMAQKQKKIVFVDAFTDWCGPCKAMSLQTFSDNVLGSFFNTNFINVKLDMEKGEGKDFAATYRVNAYPTLLFIDPTNGEIVHKVLGFQNAPTFLEQGKIAAGKNKMAAPDKNGKPAKVKKEKKPKKDKKKTSEK